MLFELGGHVDCRHGMMLVRDTPVAIDLAQSDCQPEQEPALLGRAADRGRAAAQDSGREGNIFAGCDCKLLYIERFRRLMVLEEQIPCFLVFSHSERLQRQRNVEHHDVAVMMGKNAG